MNFSMLKRKRKCVKIKSSLEKEGKRMKPLAVGALVEKFHMKCFTPHFTLNGRGILCSDVNRPALQLTGYFEHFQGDRVQVIGTVEYTYLQKMDSELKNIIYDKLLEFDVPCIIFCRGFEPEGVLIDKATKAGIPILGVEEATSGFMAELIYHLRQALAPSITIHGVLVDVYGVGVLIVGESGIGKSEAALDLIRRGHRLVADDVVELRKINDMVLKGSAPEMTKHFIEVRGIGIINVKMLFGAESIREDQTVDLVIRLSEWKSREDDYERLGLEDEYIEYLGNKVVCQSIPIRPGRNVAVICETAAVNYRQKKMGYNAAQELYGRVQESINNNNKM